MKKIMFNDKLGLTKAVLEGRKTQTRRIFASKSTLLSDDCKPSDRYSYYKVGETVAIAQSYKDCGLTNESMKSYPAWVNKMFVKAELMPHQIQITGIKIERLQDISDEDCLKEGIYEDGGNDSFIPHYFYNYHNSNSNGFKTPQLAYADLINKIACNSTWDSNPWVFVYDFVLIK